MRQIVVPTMTKFKGLNRYTAPLCSRKGWSNLRPRCRPLPWSSRHEGLSEAGSEPLQVKKKVLLCLALILLWLSSQRLFAWPIPFGWELGIGSAEWGHWIALSGLILGLASRRDLATMIACGTAASLSLVPGLTAWQMEPEFSWSRLFTGWDERCKPQTLLPPGGQPVDLYRPPNGGKTPLVLVVHGGSWARGSRSDFASLNHVLCSKGYSVASLDYRLAPQNPYPAACLDLDLAYDYLVSRAEDMGLDTRRICWLGRSAGGHLALLQAYRRRPSQAVIAYYPPTDMVWSYQNPSNPRVLDSPKALRDFLGGSPAEVAEVYREASPLQQATSPLPPTLLLHGRKDDLVYLEQSRMLCTKLSQLGTTWQRCEIPWANHGFDVNLAGPGGQVATQQVLRFLEKHLGQ